MDEMMEPTGTVDDAIREMLTSDAEAAREYLKASFLSRAMLSLFHARRDAGLTQAQLAERLGTKQSSVARLERDLSGSVTLARFIEVAQACGVTPLDLTLVPTEQLQQYVAHDPSAEKTQIALNTWSASLSHTPLTLLASVQAAIPTSMNVLQTEMPSTTTPIQGPIIGLGGGGFAQGGLWSAGAATARVGGNAA